MNPDVSIARIIAAAIVLCVLSVLGAAVNCSNNGTHLRIECIKAGRPPAECRLLGSDQ